MHKKKVLWLLGFGLIAALLVLSLVNRPAQDGDRSTAERSTTTSPEIPVEPSTGMPTSPDPAEGEHSEGGLQKKDDSQASVVGANEALNALLVGQFFPDQQMTETVNLVVAPESRQSLLESYLHDEPGRRPGVILTVRWNYNSLDEALSKSNLRSDTRQFKVKNFDPERGLATIALYSVTSFNAKKVEPSLTASFCVFEDSDSRPPPPAEAFCRYEVPGINIVEMRWVEGRWLYVGKVDLGPEDTIKLSKPIQELETEDAEAEYRPFLRERGYEPYVG